MNGGKAMDEEQFRIKTEFGLVRVMREHETEKNRDIQVQDLAEVIAKLVIENEKHKTNLG